MVTYTFYDDMVQDFMEHVIQKEDIYSSSFNQFKMQIEYLPKETRKSLQFKYYNQALKYCSIDRGNQLINQLDTTELSYRKWIDYFNSEYKLDKQIQGSFELQDKNGNFISFNQLLSNYKDSLLYINIWAGWCLPCISVMPDSKKFAEEYHNEQVKFIHLSIDKSFEKWKWYNNKYLTFANEDSFFIVNSEGNRKYASKSLGIHFIPTYLLFDKNGKVLHFNAPRPHSLHIKKLVDKYILAQ